MLPSGPRAAFIPLVDVDAVIASIELHDRKIFKEFPKSAADGSAGLLLTNAGDEATWNRRGKVCFALNPTLGQIKIDLLRVEHIYPSPQDVAWALLKALSSDSRVTFAKTNVTARVGEELLLYSFDLAVYRHREFLGWMGYVNSSLSPEQLPDASIVERHGDGTLILSTPLLDLSNPAAVEQVNRVEIRLAEMGLLPVIDPDLS